MRLYNNLFENATSLESILEAWDEFKIGKRKKPDVQEFEYRLSDNLFLLRDELVDETYRHGPYYEFRINDPKPRTIHKASVRDRIVHHVIYKSLAPIFETGFIADSFSCRKGKGTHRAVERLKIFLDKVHKTNQTCFILKCDVRKFFRSIDHDVLLEIIARKIKDRKMMSLISSVIKSFNTPVLIERERERERGCPIGNLTSQLFGNVYMNELDQFIKQALKEKYYIRYTDDFVIVHHDRNHLIELKGKIEQFLNETLKLQLHPDKVEIRKYSEGIDFLGYVAMPNARTLRTRTKRRIIRKLDQKLQSLKNESISEESFLQTFASYLGVLKNANAHGLEEKLKHTIWETIKSPDKEKREDKKIEGRGATLEEKPIGRPRGQQPQGS